MNRLSILIPGLLGPLPELAEAGAGPVSAPGAFRLEPCRALQLWLARGTCRDTGQADYFAELAALFGLSPQLSVAALSARADALDDELEHATAQMLRADPVHFRAELDHALLIGSPQLDILRHEADALVEHFNRHFADDGLRLLCAHEQRWYLQAEQPFRLDSVPVHRAMGRNVQHFLPRGDDELRWRRILNEAQMLLFTHPVNSEREARGQLTVNSLWLWGEGEGVDEAPGAATTDRPPAFDWVMADEVVARGMAGAAGCEPLHTDVQQLTSAKYPGHGLLVIDDAFLPVAAGDLPAWQDALQRICKHWIEPLHQQLKDANIASIELYTGDGRCYHINARHLLKFWRRLKPLEHDINTHA